MAGRCVPAGYLPTSYLIDAAPNLTLKGGGGRLGKSRGGTHNMKRLLVDIKENHKGELTGRVAYPADSVFVLEALVLVIQQFSLSCEVPPSEIARDLLSLIEKEES